MNIENEAFQSRISDRLREMRRKHSDSRAFVESIRNDAIFVALLKTFAFDPIRLDVDVNLEDVHAWWAAREAEFPTLTEDIPTYRILTTDERTALRSELRSAWDRTLRRLKIPEFRLLAFLVFEKKQQLLNACINLLLLGMHLLDDRTLLPTCADDLYGLDQRNPLSMTELSQVYSAKGTTSFASLARSLDLFISELPMPSRAPAARLVNAYLLPKARQQGITDIGPKELLENAFEIWDNGRVLILNNIEAAATVCFPCVHQRGVRGNRLLQMIKEFGFVPIVVYEEGRLGVEELESGIVGHTYSAAGTMWFEKNDANEIYTLSKLYLLSEAEAKDASVQREYWVSTAVGRLAQTVEQEYTAKFTRVKMEKLQFGD